MRVVAALFVQIPGIYSGREDTEAWGEEDDARLYRGPHPVIAHPPCARWSRLGALWAPAPSEAWWLGEGSVSWVGMPRRARALRARREEGHVALCVRLRQAASRAEVGLFARLEIKGARLLVWQSHQVWREQATTRKERGERNSSLV